MAKRYSIEEKAALFVEREREGLSIAALSRRTGISRVTLHSWERQVQPPPEAPDEHESFFAEVEVTDEEPVAGRTILTIRIGVATIEIAGGAVDLSLLEAVVNVLADRC